MKQTIPVAAVQASSSAIKADLASYLPMVERLPEPALLADPNGTVLAINRAGLALLEAESVEAVLGKSFISFLVPEIQAKAAAVYRTLVERPVAYPPRYELLTFKGHRRTVEVGAIPLVMSAGGRLELMLGLARDVTEQSRVESEHELLAAIVESSEDAIITKGPDLRILTWNAGAQRIYGYSPQEAVGKPVTLLMAAEHDEELKLLKQVLAGGNIKYFETRRVRKDGTLIDVSLSEAPLRDSRGRIAGIAAIERDISERVRARSLEAELAVIVKSSDDAIYSLGPGHIVKTWNAGAERMFGYRAEEVIGRRSPTMIPECQAQLDEVMARVLGGETVNFESRRRRKDGTVIDVSVTASPIHDNAGKVAGLAVITRDISERKRAERALLQAQEQLRARVRQQAAVAQLSRSALGRIEPQSLMEDAARLAAQALAADLCVIAQLRDGNQSLVRRACYPPTQGPAEVEIGRDRHAACVLGSREPVIVADFSLEARFERSRLLTGAGAASALSVIIPDSERVYGIISLSCRVPHEFSSDDVNSVQAVAYILGQVLERRRTESELRAARDAALESARAKSAFLANMSHEIRTPLNSIVGLSGLLLETTLTPEQRDFAETIRMSSDVLLETINNILDFTKISTGKTMLEKAEFDPRLVIQTAADLLADAARKKNLEMSLQVAHEVPPVLRGDPGRLRQVLVNLLSNAVKFTLSGRVSLRAMVDSESENAIMLRLEVTDTGIGIAEENHPLLFEPFFQADSSTTRKFGGSGLGLAICKQLVSLMGGQIGVRSRLGEGSTFWFTVALEKALPPAQTPPIHGHLAEVRALVVDGTESNRQITCRQMEALGMRVDFAESGAQALAVMRKESATDPYRIVVVGMQMPAMDGLELAQRIKSDPNLRQTRLVMLSSAAPPAGEPRAALFDAWFTGPLRPVELLHGPLSLARSEVAPSKPGVGTVQEATASARILLAEDNPINQKVAVMQLKKMGYQPQVVSNGRDALEAVRNSHYDLVLMDCQMPEMDGYEATRAIRAMEKGTSRHTIVLAMTAFGLSGDREKCLAAGMDDYLAKPIRAEQLREVLQRWLPVKAAAPKPGGGAIY